MKTEKNILIAFILNLSFSVFEFAGGIFTGSVAIASDAVHDLGDALGIGISYFLEKKSKQEPDGVYTYGYARYSLLGGALTTLILLVGSGVVICNAVSRLIVPGEIHYNGMIVFAVVGVLVNLAAAFATRSGDSLNQKAVNLHMLEDVLGWAVVLLGAVVIRFTDFVWIDPLMSIGVAGFILVNALKNLREIVDILLEKTPRGISPEEIAEHLGEIEGVIGVHHLHIWSLDGQNHCATVHVVTKGEAWEVKEKIRAELREHGIGHATVETEQEGEVCHGMHCRMESFKAAGHHHHHHHHH